MPLSALRLDASASSTASLLSDKGTMRRRQMPVQAQQEAKQRRAANLSLGCNMPHCGLLVTPK
eukprot:279636-Karenia_brevis.AAC.1